VLEKLLLDFEWREGQVPGRDLPVEEYALDGVGIETVHGSDYAFSFDFMGENGSLSIRKPFGGCGPVGHEEVCNDGNAGRHASLDDENPGQVSEKLENEDLNPPAPAFVSIIRMDVYNGESQQTSKCTRDGVSNHEHVDTPLEFIAGIVKTEYVDAS
jgi:hypothetical protein